MTIGGVNMFAALVLVMCGELVQLSSDMIRGTSIRVPVCVNTIGSNMSRFFLAISIIIRIIAVFVLVAPPALIGRMPIYLADLTLDFDKRCRGAVLATVTITPAIAIITTAPRAIIATATRGAVVIAVVPAVIVAARATVISAARATVIITAVAVTMATWCAVIIIGTATGARVTTSTASNVNGGGESITGVLQHGVLIMGEQLVIEAIGGEAGLAIGRGHGVIVGTIKAIEDVVDELALVDGLAKRNELGTKTLHLGKVLRHGEGVLLGGIQGTTECVDLGW
jgi:hypothetical protein